MVLCNISVRLFLWLLCIGLLFQQVYEEIIATQSSQYYFINYSHLIIQSLSHRFDVLIRCNESCFNYVINGILILYPILAIWKVCKLWAWDNSHFWVYSHTQNVCIHSWYNRQIITRSKASFIAYHRSELFWLLLVLFSPQFYLLLKMWDIKQLETQGVKLQLFLKCVICGAIIRSFINFISISSFQFNSFAFS